MITLNRNEEMLRKLLLPHLYPSTEVVEARKLTAHFRKLLRGWKNHELELAAAKLKTSPCEPAHHLLFDDLLTKLGTYEWENRCFDLRVARWLCDMSISFDTKCALLLAGDTLAIAKAIAQSN